MNSQELRNLQEAYSQVYDEEYNELPVQKMIGQIGRKLKVHDPNYYKPGALTQAKKLVKVMDTHSERKARKKSKLKNEEVDIYDVILSHLLDEGYAETQEAAEVIMVNMSDDWREGILSEAILEYQPFKDKRKRVKSKVKKLESQKSGDPKDLGFRNARLQKRIDSMKTVLGKKNKEIASASQQKSYDSMAKGGVKHHDDPQSKYYIK